MTIVWVVAALGWFLVLTIGAVGLRAAVRNRHG